MPDPTPAIPETRSEAADPSAPASSGARTEETPNWVRVRPPSLTPEQREAVHAVTDAVKAVPDLQNDQSLREKSATTMKDGVAENFGSLGNVADIANRPSTDPSKFPEISDPKALSLRNSELVKSMQEFLSNGGAPNAPEFVRMSEELKANFAVIMNSATAARATRGMEDFGKGVAKAMGTAQSEAATSAGEVVGELDVSHIPTEEAATPDKR